MIRKPSGIDITCISELKNFIKSDFIKIYPNGGNKQFFIALLCEPGFKYCFWLRITRFLFLDGGGILFLLARWCLKHYQYKFGFDISYRTRIGAGLSISHFGTIVVAAESIGENCTLRPGCVIGSNLKNHSNPVIGDCVEFGVGSKVIGDIVVGNDVIIGANAVVTKSVPDKSIVAGIPAKVIGER